MGQFRIASLFCGCGGVDLGFKGGFEFNKKKYIKHAFYNVYSNDSDKKISEIYNSNFINKVDVRDIRKVSSDDIPDHDLLLGGLHCTSFSIVAQNPKRLGVSAPEGDLFYEMCRVLHDKQPRAFLAENVRGILSVNNKMAFPLIIDEFKQCGYKFFYLLLNSYHYGVPQNRERVFIVGFKSENDLNYFRPPSPVKDFAVLGDVIDTSEKIEEKYFFSEKAHNGLTKSNKKMKKGRSQKLNKPCNTVGSHLAKVSLNSTDPVLFVDGRFRRFTPREVSRIQSFPETYNLNSNDTHLYRALGNAVPPVMAWHIATSIENAFLKNF